LFFSPLSILLSCPFHLLLFIVVLAMWCLLSSLLVPIPPYEVHAKGCEGRKQLACFFHPSGSFHGNSSHLPALMIMILIMTHLRRVWAGTSHRGVGVSSMYGTSAVVWRIQPSLCCIFVSSIFQPRWESFPIFKFDDCGGLLKSSSRRPNNVLILYCPCWTNLQCRSTVKFVIIHAMILCRKLFTRATDLCGATVRLK
jgi:hypothetical protein